MTYADRYEYIGVSVDFNLKLAPTITDNLDGSVRISIDPSFMNQVPSLYRIVYSLKDSS
jgi:hypothetical protein